MPIFNPAGGNEGNGLSAYQVAVNAGFTGSEAAWLLSLKGEPGVGGNAGADGQQGIQGIPGNAGADGADSIVPGPQGVPGAGEPGAAGADGAPGVDGTDGTNGTNGTTPVKGTDYFDGADGAKGDQGDPGATTWAGITDKPGTFTPTAHDQATSTITGLDTALSGKEAAGVAASAVSTHAALKTGAHGLLNSIRIRPQVTPTAETGAVTLTIAKLLTGIIQATPAGAVAYTLPTGTLCDAGMTIGVDEAFEWVLSNISTTAANIITLTAGAGHTIVGCAKVPSNSTTTGGLWGTASATYRTRKTAANTFVTYRIG